jgi:hypothetical protein
MKRFHFVLLIILLLGSVAILWFAYESQSSSSTATTNANNATALGNTNAAPTNTNATPTLVSTDGWQLTEFGDEKIRFSHPATFHAVGPRQETFTDTSTYLLVGVNAPFQTSVSGEPVRTNDTSPLFQVRLYRMTLSEFLETTLADYGSAVAQGTKQIGGQTARTYDSIAGPLSILEYRGNVYLFLQGNSYGGEEDAQYETILSTVQFLD